MTPEEQRVDDLQVMEAVVRAWDCGDPVYGDAEFAERLRRILGALTPEPSDYLCELEDIVSDALHTLENEKTAGTQFNEPGWVDGTLSALRSIVGTMDAMRSLRLPTVATPRQD